MKKYLLAAYAALALGGPAMAQPAGATYEARGVASGFLLRAAMVCREQYDWRAMADAGVRLLAGPMRPITNGYPQTVKAWGAHGAGLFNTGVMTDGVGAACALATKNVATARAVTAGER
jgi:hypothetical protein